MKKHSMKGCWMFKQIRERQTVKKMKERDKQWKGDSKGLFFCVWRNYCLWMLNIDWLSININAEELPQSRHDSRFLFFVSCVHNNLSGLRRQGLEQMGAHLGGSSGIGSIWGGWSKHLRATGTRQLPQRAMRNKVCARLFEVEAATDDGEWHLTCWRTVTHC